MWTQSAPAVTARCPVTADAWPEQSASVVHGAGAVAHCAPLQPPEQAQRHVAARFPSADARKPEADCACAEQSLFGVQGASASPHAL